MNNEVTLEARVRKNNPYGIFFVGSIRKLDTKCERRLRKMGGIIRSKPDWITNIFDPNTHSNWVTEARSQGLTDIETGYVLEELAYYATLHIPDSSSNCVVRNIVDPLMYPLSYKSSSFVGTRIESPEAALKMQSFGRFPGDIDEWDREMKSAFPWSPISKRYPFSVAPNTRTALQEFCWLPSEFLISADGQVEIKSYTNNLNPVKYASLYPVIAEVFSKCVPLLENVVTDVVYPRKSRVMPNCSNWLVTDEPEPRDYCAPDYDERFDAWQARHRFIEPQPEPFEVPERPQTPFSLRGRQLQAVVRMTNIDLTPETPMYNDDRWCLEAISKERIVAIGVCCYDVDNITDMHLEFRELVDDDIEHEQCDERGLDLAYGIFDNVRNGRNGRRAHAGDNVSDNEEDEEMHFNTDSIDISQEIGQVKLQNGRCIVFPNTYQRRFSKLQLVNRNIPGHCKMLIFYFVIPTDPIVLTEIVPPQQQDWWVKDVFQVEPLVKMPTLVLDNIIEHVDCPMSLSAAKEIRAKLEKERRENSDNSGLVFFTPTFYYNST
ncbi:hypothetical protein LPJ66_005728 [Kickxella alabastrina]|uniref:Uncharacterized protein n=1 Tax=Kickxella alabastrina TaxID=61397 RepID=A0ACC1IDY1_9FUNG|nr:hypothetical protein LPJ66_005728 [Kickxella alabastrina]